MPIRRTLTKSRAGHWKLTLTDTDTGRKAHGDKHDTKHGALSEEDALMAHLQPAKPSTPVIPRDTLMASLLQRSAHAADSAAGRPTVAEEAIATADAHLDNAVLPTYTEMRAALAAVTELAAMLRDNCADRVDCSGDMRVADARALLARHDKTMAGDFGAPAAGYRSAECAERRMGC